MSAEARVYTTFAASVQERCHELEQQNALLHEKNADLIAGGVIRCLNQDCGNLLYGRLLAGYVTCSPKCQAALKAQAPMLKAMRQRQLAERSRTERRKVAALVRRA